MQRLGARWLGPVYRMTTRVEHFAWATKTYPTFTLPRYVDLG